MIKRTGTAADSWVIFNNALSPHNLAGESLQAENSGAESVAHGSSRVDLLSNGFKARGTSTNINNTETYIYLAFGETPFKYANGR